MECLDFPDNILMIALERGWYYTIDLEYDVARMTHVIVLKMHNTSSSFSCMVFETVDISRPHVVTEDELIDLINTLNATIK